MGKVETLECRQADPVDLVDGTERAHRERRQNCEAVQVKGSGNRVELIAGDGSQLCSISADKISCDLLDAVDLNGARCRGVNGDIAIVAPAASDLLGVCAAGDGEWA